MLLKTKLLRAIKQEPIDPKDIKIFGSDVAHRMVDFAQRNAERAGVAHAVQLRGGDALQRMPPMHGQCRCKARDADQPALW